MTSSALFSALFSAAPAARPLAGRLVLCAVLPLSPLLAGAARAAEPAAPAEKSEPVVETLIVEDEGMRVEELRVRGEPQKVVVQTKGRLKGQYEILVPTHGSTGAAAGQRVWHVLSF